MLFLLHRMLGSANFFLHTWMIVREALNVIFLLALDMRIVVGTSFHWHSIPKNKGRKCCLIHICEPLTIIFLIDFFRNSCIFDISRCVYIICVDSWVHMSFHLGGGFMIFIILLFKVHKYKINSIAFNSMTPN